MTFFYAFIEPKLNRKDLYHAYVDKNSYNKLFGDIKTPKTVLWNLNGKYYDENYERVEVSDIYNILNKYKGEYIIKPSMDSGSGKNIIKLQCHSQKIFIEGKYISFDDIATFF